MKWPLFTFVQSLKLIFVNFEQRNNSILKEYMLHGMLYSKWRIFDMRWLCIVLIIWTAGAQSSCASTEYLYLKLKTQALSHSFRHLMAEDCLSQNIVRVFVQNRHTVLESDCSLLCGNPNANTRMITCCTAIWAYVLSTNSSWIHLPQ